VVVAAVQIKDQQHSLHPNRKIQLLKQMKHTITLMMALLVIKCFIIIIAYLHNRIIHSLILFPPYNVDIIFLQHLSLHQYLPFEMKLLQQQ
jgi:hypothetical protein